MTIKQIESAEDHYDDYLRYGQECFGVSWTPGNPCDICDNKKECSEKYISTHPPMASARVTTCEYEHRNETRAHASHTTDPTQYTLYVHYTCGCFYCAHPERECRVKQP
jgi:hypothetical protein